MFYLVSKISAKKRYRLCNKYYNNWMREVSGLTWKTMWERLSWSRSRGARSCSFLPFRMNIALPLGNTRSSEMSENGSPTMGTSRGTVSWLISATINKLINLRNLLSRYTYLGRTKSFQYNNLCEIFYRIKYKHCEMADNTKSMTLN